MTPMAPNSELMLFITHVETDGPLLKIWGQIDRNAATCVERMILPLVEKFAQGLGLPNINYPVPLNAICCARFQNEGYYRAKICSVQPGGNVLVHFIDYGNFEILPPSAIRLLDNIPGSVSLLALHPLALDFVLANIFPANGSWDIETVESIKQTLRYADLKGMLHSVIGSNRLLKLCYNNEDFGDLLVSKKLAVRVSLQEMFSSRRAPVLPNRSPQPCAPPNINAARENAAHAPEGAGYPHRNQHQNVIQNATASQEDWRNPAQRQNPQNVPEALVFKSRVLDVGSIHDVFVSYVEDGPLKFAVQVQSTSQILKQLMSDINRYPTAPLQEPPLPGSVCLGRYSVDKVLCRAVVMSVMEHKCKLYYVDFGHTEVLPYSDIFQLPPQYINPKVLSIRFTLSGLKDMVITDETKEYFKKMVTRKPLVLQVRPPEGPPLIQYGDLYENGTNIRDILKERCASMGQAFFQDPLRLKRGAKEIVHVSFVESCSKFFVQLDSEVESLTSIMACLAEYAKNAPQLEENFIKVGTSCCACYGEDKQWYRAQILSVNGDQATVLYVDYGNEETVVASTLKKIHINLVTNLKSQAIKCCLNGYQSLALNQEIANQFELLVLEKKLAMEVIDALPNETIVQLFDCSVVPMVNIASQLQIPNTPLRGGGLDSSINSQGDGEQHLNSSRSPDRKYQTDERNSKWGRNSKPNTWSQETRSADWNSRGRSNNHHDGKEHFEDKPRTKIVKDVENEQRQRDSNRYDGEDRLQQKEVRNNHFNRNNQSSGGSNRFERNEDTSSRRGRGSRFGSGGRTPREDNRFDKNTSKDDSWSDRDSDTSSRSSGKRPSKGPRGIKGRTDRGERGGRRGGERRSSSGKWSDGDSDRSSQKSTQNSGFRARDRNATNSSWKNTKTQPNKTGTWNSMSPTSPVKELPRGQKLKIPPPNITVGAIKNAEIIYTDSPTDFYIQLCPDNLELDKLMEKIAQKYNEGGTIMKKSEIQSGISCIAQYSVDSKWYRAIVKTTKPDSIEVHFIDYGNSETVGYEKIKELHPEFANLSAQAVHCKLFAATKLTWTDKEIDEFSQSAEGISLEAEFLAQNNGLYEVLIKPAGENIPGNNNYVNNLFSGNTDLIQAKKDLKNKNRGGFNHNRNDSVKKYRETPHYIEPGEKWRDEAFQPGYQVDVVVTWFVNPNNFYCQILSKQSEFRTMMNNIQESYVEQQPTKNPLKVGEPVIAFFSDDGALYRAEIRELNKLRGHIVQYVDFGNCAMVDPSKIYPVEKRFTLLYKQAMHCSLKNVSPVTGADWSNASKHDIDKYFDADKYKCTFHGTKDGKYIISLCHNGKDIGDSMTDAKLAVNPELITKKHVVDNVSSKDQNPDIINAEIQDLKLWRGQIIRTIVKNVQGASKFFVQLPESNAAQNQVVECYLLNVNTSPQVDETLKKSVEEKEAIVDIKNVNNQIFAVEIYDTSGKKVKLVDSEIEEWISPICPMPVSVPRQQVWVTHIEDSENIWLQRSSDSENIAELLSSLYDYYSISGSPLVPEKGKLCVAESADKNWYRAMIESITEESDSAKVRFIDYGNLEEVLISTGIKTLEEKFNIPNQMAIRVSLVVRLKGSQEEQEKILYENLDDKEFMAHFYNVGNNWLVELYDSDSKKVSDKLTELNLVDESKDLKPQEEEIPEMIVGNKYQVFLSHSDSPAQFWLQRNEEIDAIETMQTNLQIEAQNFSPIVGIPEEGTLCAALYSADGMWYRAEVLDADEDITTVRFIDYGNTDVVDSNSNNIKELPKAWKSVKKYGLKSRLDLIPTGSEDWSTASCEMFEKMATAASSPITALIIADSFPRRVELFVEDNSIGDALVKEGHAIMVHNAEDLIDEIIELELDPRSAFVSHVNSPNEFWVQEEKSVSDLEIMTDRFIVAEMFPKLEDIKEGKLCVAKFPDDEQWYRAKINSHTTSGTQVLYIDYGNSSISTEVREIPEDLANVAPLSRKCSLQLPTGVKEWSAKACDKFIELAADGATIFLLDVIKEGETSVVNLTLDGINVADELTELCDSLPVIDERLPPLGEENSPNIVVSHVYSPSEFWTQAEASMSELEIMAGRLIDAQSLLPLNIFDEGTICAAKFPEDGEWYRAKILNHSEAGTNVLYFDYGNSALTTELRILPEDVANIPSLAMKCTLALPEDVESWSKEANDKFIQLVADGATMFQFEILDNNDPTLIALQLDGKDVVDILKPLCKQKVSTERDSEEIIKTLETEIVEKQDEVESKICESEVHVNQEIENTEKVETEALQVPEIQLQDGANVGHIQNDDSSHPELEKTQVVSFEQISEIKEPETDKPDENEVTKAQIPAPESSKENPTDEINISKTVKVETTEDAVIVDELLLVKEELNYESTEGTNSTELVEPAVVNTAEIITPKVEPDLGGENLEENVSEISVALDSVELNTSVEAKKEVESLTELTVDDIVENMVKVALVEGADDLKVEEEELSAVESSVVEINKAETSGEKIDKVENSVEEIENAEDSIVEVEKAENRDEESREKVANGVEETEEVKERIENVLKEVESVVSAPSKAPIIEKIVPGSISRGSLEEDIPFNVLGRRRSSCTEDKIVPGAINKGDDLTEAEIIDLTNDDEDTERLISTVGKQQLVKNSKEEETAAVVTPGKTERENKIVPGSISRGESPTAELGRPTTPKTPHSEKILAGVVNLQENLEDFDERDDEDDEIITVEVENNIPDKKSS